MVNKPSDAENSLKSHPPSPLSELFSGTLKYSIGGLAARAVQLISIPLYLKYLSPREYGLQSITLLNESIFGILAGYVAIAGVDKYYTQARPDKKRQGQVLGTALCLLIGTGALFFVAIETAASWLAKLSIDMSPVSLSAIRLMGISFYANLFVNLLMSVWQLDQYVALYVGANLVRQILSVAVGIILVVFFSAGVIGVLWGWVGASVLLAVVALSWYAGQHRLSFDWDMLGALVRYGSPLVPGAFLMMVLNGFDRFWLKHTFDLSLVGIYAVNFTLAAAVNLAVVSPFKQMWGPIMWKVRGKPEEADVHRRALTYYVVVQVFILSALVLFNDLGIRLFSGGRTAYVEASGIVPMFYLGIALFGTYDITAAGYFFEAKTYYFTMTALLSALVNMVLNVVLVPLIGIKGSALAYAFSYVVFAILSYGYGQKYFKVEFEWNRMGKALGVGIIVSAFGLAARRLGGVAGILSAMLALSAYPLALFGSSFFSSTEIDALKRLMQRLRQRP